MYGITNRLYRRTRLRDFSTIKNVIALWEEILNLGKDHGIKPVGLGCRDTLRMEMNYALYGNEINENINPFEAGLGWITSMKKNKFIEGVHY